MTARTVVLTVTHADGTPVTDGTVEFTPTTHRMESGAVVLGDTVGPFAVGGTVTVPMLPVGMAYRVRVAVPGRPPVVRTVIVPDGAGTIALADLVDVDPASLSSAPVPAAWTAAIDSVTARVEEVAAGKVGKVATTGPDRAYIVNSSGVTTVRDIANAATPWTIPQRLAGGELTGGTATDPTHLVPKAQMDAALAGKRDAATGTARVYIRNSAGVETTVGYAAQASTVDTIAMRDGVGALHTAAPTASTHAATKGYVDDRVAETTPTCSLYLGANAAAVGAGATTAVLLAAVGTTQGLGITGSIATGLITVATDGLYLIDAAVWFGGGVSGGERSGLIMINGYKQRVITAMVVGSWPARASGAAVVYLAGGSTVGLSVWCSESVIVQGATIKDTRLAVTRLGS